jgi:hypothetical protein
MMEFWEEKLGIPAEPFNPLRCVGLSASARKASVPPNASLLGEHVGLALQAALETPVSINIIPPAVHRKKRIGQYALVSVLAAACVCAPLVAWGLFFQQAEQITSSKASSFDKEIAEAKKWDKEIKASSDRIQQAIKLAEPLKKAAIDRRYWVTLLETIHACLPKELVWVTNLEIVKPAPPSGPASKTPAPAQKTGTTRLVLKGFYLENPKGVEVVDEFGMALQFKASLDKTISERAQGGTALSPKDSADILQEEIKKIRTQCVNARWDSASVDAFCERLKAIPFPDQPTSFEVAPIQDWVRPNSPSPTQWTQEFVIPLDLLAPPISSNP